MIVTKYLCDRCDKEMKRNEIYKVEVSEGLGESDHNCASSYVHLCKDCVKLFLQWIHSTEKYKKY